jgi:DNA polymerase IV
VAPNKFLAKMASDLKKPDGLVVVEHGQEAEFLSPLPVGKLWGIGAVTATALKARGILTIGQLAQLPDAELKHFFGQNAQTIRELSRGCDARPVVPDREAKSIGAEETFGEDLHLTEAMYTVLMGLAERIGYRLRREKLMARTVTLKLRYGTFQTLTRRRTLSEATQVDDILYRVAVDLLMQQDLSAGVRLLGITASQLEAVRPVDCSLFADTDTEEKGRHLSVAMDRMRAKYGQAALVHGRLASKQGKDESKK